MRYIYIGKTVKCSVFLPVLLYFWYVISGARTFLCLVFAVVIHEAGHIIAGLAMRRMISSFTLSPLGADIEYSGAVSYGAEIIIALAGPLASVLAGAACFFSRDFAVVSVIYGIINLIPVPCFDGGRALRFFICFFFDILLSDKICSAVNIIFLIIMYLFSVFLLFYTSFNATLLFLCAYVFLNSYVKMK